MVAMFNEQPVFGPQGEPGATFTPSVSESGELSWTNDGGLPNPEPVNIKGQKGEDVREVYSTEETVIGTWIDGKPLYRKVFQLTLPNNDSNGMRFGDIQNVDWIVNCYGIILLDNRYPFPLNTTDSYYESLTNPVSSNLFFDKKYAQPMMRFYGLGLHNAQCKVVYEYTKTTDTASTVQANLLTSKVDLMQSSTLSAQDVGSDAPVRVAFPSASISVESSGSSGS